MSEEIKIGLVQHSCTADLEENWQATYNGMLECLDQGAKLILLPELHGSLYFCQTEDTVQFDLSEKIPGRTSERLKTFAAEHQCVIVGSIFEKRAPGLYHNTAVVFDSDKGMVGMYRKMHIPDDPGYYEKFYFTPGDLGFHPVDTSIGKLGVLVCWDQWFPEAARIMALSGAEVLLYPTAIGWDENDSPDEKSRQLEAWKTVQRGHAVANGLPVVACNRTGIERAPNGEDKINFWGNSFVAGPQGEILAQTNTEPCNLVTTISRARSEAVRRIWPFLRDRRIDAYEALLMRFNDQ